MLATSFVRPVNDLIARVQQARSGNTDVTFATETGDEIGDLSRSFSELIAGVKSRPACAGGGNAAESAVARET